MPEEKDLIFREVQTFSSTLRWLLVLLMAVSFAIFAIALWETITNPKTTNTLISTLLSIFAMAIPIAVTILFFILKLETEVRTDGLYVRFYPMHIRFRKFTRENLAEFYARTYKPIREYGGWGIRCSFTGKGKAYNVSGNKGVQLVLTNGKKLLIGSQKPDELAAAIDKMLK
ncbi:MAG: hypothetical protein GWN67_09965 [Phycisphaerae bacterium]|nr:hypothetical protein [Phycisphaerae bacterium]NIP52421.1 hypothetical protein [Phycisphaerae bacterium]NIS51414.1 hypothetical protein [Phycisphaerae bacterium]NIU09029.1 hypothetical protein [Phycisphaerae bacterium]NIU56689.1 hypothetical protein [Phycisphaerae bacterium]